ncbi:nucleotidyltransferase family protein [Micromonospora fluostatini]
MPIRATARNRALPRRARRDLDTFHRLSDARSCAPMPVMWPGVTERAGGRCGQPECRVRNRQSNDRSEWARREAQMAERGDETLVHTLKKVAAVLKQSAIPFALGGSFAVYAHGGHSSDHDVDFLIRGEDVDRALAELDAAGFRTERPPEDWLVKVFDGDRMVDLIHRPIETPVTEETFTDTVVRPVDAIHMPVLSATQLMVHKLLSFSQHYCDFARGLPLARSLREQIDWERVRKETQHSPYAEAFLVLLDRLDVVPYGGPPGGKEAP